MAKDRLLGKLAVILHADVADSTRLVQQDEQLAHERIQDAFRRFSENIEKYMGSVLELRGDALLAEFERPSDAVTAALSFQADQAYHNSRTKDGARPTVRVGIAMGEVIVADNTVTGAGVVLAQRIEQLADPGGLCITEALHEAIPKRMPFDLENLGEQVLKGFDDPVRVYRAELSAGHSIPAPQQTSQGKLSPKKPKLMVLIIVVAIVVIGGFAYWFNPQVPQEEPASVERMAFPLPDKPSIAVLPFTNISNDVEQEYFADGMTEDLITDISKVPGLFVIARNSVFTYKGKSVKIRQVAEELGVRYVMEGSVRRVGNQVRINAQLIDATTGGHVWAERYDGALDDVFSMQDKITQSIVASLSVTLVGQNQGSSEQVETNNSEAYDAFLQGWPHYKLGTREDLARSISYFEAAVRLDPSYAQAHAALASVYWDAYVNDWAFDIDMPSYLAESRADEHLEEALKTPTPLAHLLQSSMFASFGLRSEAVVEAEKAVALDPNNATALAGLANALVLADRPGEGLTLIRDAMRLDPHYSPSYLTILGAVQFGMENYEGAVATFKRAIKRDPGNEMPLIYLASSYGHLGQMQEADDAIESANVVAMVELSLGPEQGSSTPFMSGIDFARVGGKQAQARFRAGLSKIPALTWQYLVTVRGEGTNPWWEVEGSTEIDVATAKSFQEEGAIFVDVSDRAVWERGHIPGAVNLTRHQDFEYPERKRLTQRTLQEIANKSEKVVFYRCFHNRCGRGEGMTAKALNWGYTEVFFLPGGTRTWKEAGYPVETSD
jgi:adenylate cyclase